MIELNFYRRKYYYKKWFRLWIVEAVRRKMKKKKPNKSVWLLKRGGHCVSFSILPQLTTAPSELTFCMHLVNFHHHRGLAQDSLLSVLIINVDSKRKKTFNKQQCHYRKDCGINMYKFVAYRSPSRMCILVGWHGRWWRRGGGRAREI